MRLLIKGGMFETTDFLLLDLLLVTKDTKVVLSVKGSKCADNTETEYLLEYINLNGQP